MGLRRTEQHLFFFRLFLGEKQFTHSSSLYFRVLHRANIAVRAAFDHHRAFQRRKQADSSWRERCRLLACGVNSLFLALTKHIWASFSRSLLWSHLPANIERQSTGRRARTEFTRVCMHATLTASDDRGAWKKHDSRPVSKFIVSMKHWDRLGSKKKISLIHGSSEKSQSKKRSIAKESLSSAKDFPVFVYMCMPVTKDAIIV